MTSVVKNQTFIEPQDDPQFLLVMDYLRVVEFDGQTDAQFATKHNVNPATLWRWKTRWKKDGLLSKCREITSIALFEDITVETRRFVRNWARPAAELQRLALEARREDVRLSAIQTIWREFVKPELDRQVEPGSEEQEYIDFIISNPQGLDPMTVSHLLDEQVDDVAHGEIEDSVAEDDEPQVE